MPKNNCAVCIHVDRIAIDAALLAGERLNAVATQYGISQFSVGRHRRKHLAPAEPPAAGDADEIELWAARADACYLQSEIDQDSRGMVSALGVALKALDAKQKARERQAEQESTELSHDPNQWTEKQAAQFLAYMDHVIREGERLPHAEDEYALALSKQHAPDLHRIFLRLQERPDWMRQVKEFCSTLFAGEHEHDYESVSQQVTN
jgi:hypothetical protein